MLVYVCIVVFLCVCVSCVINDVMLYGVVNMLLVCVLVCVLVVCELFNARVVFA